MHSRERQILEALGDARLTVRELTEVVGERHPEFDIYRPNVVSIVTRLWKARDLDREAEGYRGRPRYRYFRRNDLDDVMAQLDRQLEDGA